MVFSSATRWRCSLLQGHCLESVVSVLRKIRSLNHHFSRVACQGQGLNFFSGKICRYESQFKFSLSFKARWARLWPFYWLLQASLDINLYPLDCAQELSWAHNKMNCLFWYNLFLAGQTRLKLKIGWLTTLVLFSVIAMVHCDEYTMH